MAGVVSGSRLGALRAIEREISTLAMLGLAIELGYALGRHETALFLNALRRLRVASRSLANDLGGDDV